ncbi:hypothetical protein EX895_000281 [Sporisorium graminicola]|uniref:DUF2306 domain-containing protein n=1 Tax=Sporisorium graminicola TaxID=280036 RepID=A0A4U7KZN4_9BASI|nr:hypothetical protein EX895_000281 [Sporisorium graminicola]TKY90283.1 hypothetical protein EX895_000281 [Sporisorium graminicola]
MLAKPSRATVESRGWLSLLRTMLWFSVLAYIPMSATYFLRSDPRKPRLQDFVLARLVSDTFAYGVGSGNDGHGEAYVETHATMLLHSLAGSIALALGLSQFSDSFRKAYPTVHRWFGYVYVTCGGTLVPLSAVNFLLRTGPLGTFSGPSFAFILWLLSGATALTAFLALQAAMQRKIERHRDLIALNFAFMCSAPLLRYAWIVLGNFWDETKEFINLISGVWASSFLLCSAIFYIRTRKGRPQHPRKPITAPTIVAVLASAVLGTLFLAAKIPATQWWRPVPLFWCTVPPLVVEQTAFLVLAIAATDDNSRAYWHTFILGLFTFPLWASVSFEICRYLLHGDSGTAWYSAVVGGWGVSGFFSFLVNVYSTSYLVDDRKHFSDAIKPKALL